MIGGRITLYILLAGAILAAVAISLLAYNAQPGTYVDKNSNNIASTTNNSGTSPTGTSTELSGSWHGSYSSRSGSGEWMFTLTKNERNHYIGELITNGPYSTHGQKVPITVLVSGERIHIYIPALEMNITGRIVNGELQGIWSFSNGEDHGEWRGIRGVSLITDIKTTTISDYTSNETRTNKSNPFDNVKEINPPDREPYNKIVIDTKKVLTEIFGGAKLARMVSSSNGKMYVEYIVKTEIVPGNYSLDKMSSMYIEMGYTVTMKANSNDEFVIVFTFMYEDKITYITIAGKTYHQTVSLLINYT